MCNDDSYWPDLLRELKTFLANQKHNMISVVQFKKTDSYKLDLLTELNIQRKQ